MVSAMFRRLRFRLVHVTTLCVLTLAQTSEYGRTICVRVLNLVALRLNSMRLNHAERHLQCLRKTFVVPHGDRKLSVSRTHVLAGTVRPSCKSLGKMPV